MNNFNATVGSFIVMAAIATPALAGQEPMPLRPQSPQAQPAPPQDAPQRPDIDTRAAEDKTSTGRLVRVDTDEMVIVIKDAADQEQQFSYTDKTKVVGAQEQISGLSTKAGSLVIVHYTQGAGKTRIATKVHFDTQK